MAVLTHDALMDAIKAHIGEDTSDEALKFIEDVKDTFESMNTDGTDWKQKYEENDAAWRTRYKERFFNQAPIDNPDDLDEKPVLKSTFESLFKE